jgi:hypothetical protein
MSKTLAEFLNELDPDRDTVHQALRLYISEHSGDLTPEEMLEEMTSAAADPAAVKNELASLEADGAKLEDAALAFFDRTWRDQPDTPELAAVFASAKAKLPVVETTVIAIAAMYAMYLLITKGVTKIEIRTIRRPDGSFEEVRSEERSPFAPIVSAFGDITGPG